MANENSSYTKERSHVAFRNIYYVNISIGSVGLTYMLEVGNCHGFRKDHITKYGHLGMDTVEFIM